MPLNEDEKAELVAYLDGELDEPATQAIEAMLATNPDARAELDSLKQTWGMLDYLPKASPSPNFTNRTLEKLSLESIRTAPASKSVPAAPRRVRWRLAVGWAASVMLAIGLGYWAAPHLFPAANSEPSDEPLVRHLPILEKWRFYENVDDRDFINGLAQPDLFGDEPS
jgi:anti-sigma factor RsiW